MSHATLESRAPQRTAAARPDRAQAVPIYLNEERAPLEWPAARPEPASAWHGHVSFAHWLVHAMRPRVVVELGTHNGISFTAFCHAAERSRTETQCYAVDTWEGDKHAGRYSETVYSNLSEFLGARFPRTATMLRGYFDDALPKFEDGTVDLLHIDGLHTYEAVKHDFDTWLPKMSDRGVILFHDTMVRRSDFAVWQLWDELSKSYPSFNFEHSSGLGVLAVGANVAEPVIGLCSLGSEAEMQRARQCFALASGVARREGLAQAQQARAAEQQKRAGAGAGANIALYKKAAQSSAFREPATPEGAVNGVHSGECGFQTALEDRPWWMVDLGAVMSFDEIKLYNWLRHPLRARSLCILTSEDGEAWQQIYTHDGSHFGGADGHPLHLKFPGSRARFVRLKLRERQILHLDEVEIISHAAPGA